MYTMTLRLTDEQGRALDQVAEVDDMPVVKVVRMAISEYLVNRVEDQDFQDRLERMLKENAETLARLAR